MEILRHATNPWGQNILIGVAWDLMWAALFAGILFVVGHALYLKVLAPAPTPADGAGSGPSGAGAAMVPERVERHSAASRGFHWLMAVTMFVLLVTAFFPVVGIQFAWVTIHWIAGVALTLLIVYHILHATLKQDWRAVWVGKSDVAQGRAAVARFFRREPDPDARTGKYPLDQKLYHHAATVVSLGAIVTGLLMMLRIETPFWDSNPYFLSDATWGLVFVLHGLCGVALITLVIAHVYFAIRPEKRWMTRSMIKGWITREEYLAHYDPAQWPVGGRPAAEPADGGPDRAPDPDAVAPA